MRPIAVDHPKDVIKKEDGFLAYYFSAQLANLTVRFSHQYLQFITPNWFTTISLALGLWAAWMFAQGDSTSLIYGVILLNISFILDCCDGQLARLSGKGSRFGAWFDYHSDKVKDGFLYIAFAYGWFVVNGSMDWWIFLVAFAGIYFQFFRNINALNRDLITYAVEGKKDTARSFFETSDNTSQLIRTIKHSSLFKLSDRVLLYTVCGIIGWQAAAVIIYASLAFFFSSVSAYLNYKVSAKYDKAAK